MQYACFIARPAPLGDTSGPYRVDVDPLRRLLSKISQNPTHATWCSLTAEAAYASRTLDDDKPAKPGRLMRPLLVAGFVLAVLIGGALLNAQRDQQNAQQRGQAEQLQQNLAMMTATTAAGGTVSALFEATQKADPLTQQVPIDAQATQSPATLTASRPNLDLTVTAGQVSARATNTALAQR